MEAVPTSESSVDNHFTRQYIPEDNSEHHTRRSVFLNLIVSIGIKFWFYIIYKLYVVIFFVGGREHVSTVWFLGPDSLNPNLEKPFQIAVFSFFPSSLSEVLHTWLARSNQSLLIMLYYPSQDKCDTLKTEEFRILMVGLCDAHSMSLMSNFLLTHDKPNVQSGERRHDVKQNCPCRREVQ
jgi:hypothetical protein